MKNLTTLITLLSCNILFSQNYTFFPEAKAIWNQTHKYLPNCGSFPCKITQYIQDGDTIIDFKRFNKLYESGERIADWNRTDPNFPIPIYEFYNIGYIGAIRQDSSSKKIFYLPKDYEKDTLLYDFNLSVGDPVPITFINNLIDTIIKIDSVELTNGQFVKRYHPSKIGYEDMYLIEGIGSSLGLITQFYFGFEEYDNLNCHFRDNIWIYPSNASCEILTSAHNVINDNFEFSYNYRESTISYKSINNRISKIVIYDIMGNQLFVNNPESRNFSVKLDKEFGIYFSLITFDNGDVITKKFLVR